MSKFLLGVQSNLGLERRKEGNKRKHKKEVLSKPVLMIASSHNRQHIT